MYTATMNYYFKPEFYEKACELWREGVIKIAEKREGFIRMQFLVDGKNRAMAIGTWKSTAYAQDFMETGVFKNLMNQLKNFIEKDPEPKVWDLKYYSEKK